MTATVAHASLLSSSIDADVDVLRIDDDVNLVPHAVCEMLTREKLGLAVTAVDAQHELSVKELRHQVIRIVRSSREVEQQAPVTARAQVERHAHHFRLRAHRRKLDE